MNAFSGKYIQLNTSSIAVFNLIYGLMAACQVSSYLDCLRFTGMLSGSLGMNNGSCDLMIIVISYSIIKIRSGESELLLQLSTNLVE